MRERLDVFFLYGKAKPLDSILLLLLHLQGSPIPVLPV